MLPVSRPPDDAPGPLTGRLATAPPTQPVAAVVTTPGHPPLLALASPAHAPWTDAIRPGPTDLGRMVLLPYEIGRAIEPAAARRALPHDALALAIDLSPLPPSPLHPSPPATIPASSAPAAQTPLAEPIAMGPLSSRSGREAFLKAAERALGYIRAGDVYQVNLAHVLTAEFHGSPRALFDALLRSAHPDFAAYAELPDGRAVVSASPELFLAYNARDGSALTRPMKGTRPLDADPTELEMSPKDRAELDMITDLMRNDLGRIARPGSVRVVEARRIERHRGGQLQATSTVSASLRPGLGLADILTAAFPPGSITGAPKVRAMQIIEQLEPADRGFYCGSIGHIAPDGSALFSVAIRTATLTPTAPGRWRLDLPVGAGIVADSDPASEWEETLLKAEAFRSAPLHNDPAAHPAPIPRGATP